MTWQTLQFLSDKSWDLMIIVSVVFVAGLAFMFKEGGGKIQKIVLEKHNTRYVRSATIIDGSLLVDTLVHLKN